MKKIIHICVCVYICITDSLCCTAEINTIVNYSSIKVNNNNVYCFLVFFLDYKCNLWLSMGLSRWCQWQRTHLPMQETGRHGFDSLGWKDPLEEGMAILSSILTWRIPWTEEPGRFQSTGFPRVGYNWNDLAPRQTRKQ